MHTHISRICEELNDWCFCLVIIWTGSSTKVERYLTHGLYTSVLNSKDQANPQTWSLLFIKRSAKSLREFHILMISLLSRPHHIIRHRWQTT